MTGLPTHVCRRTAEPIIVDGHLSERVWSRLAPVGDFVLAGGTGVPQLPTELKICWDDSALYLAFVAVDADIWGTMRQRDDSIYEEEVVEAFLACGEAASASPATMRPPGPAQAGPGASCERHEGDDLAHYYEFEFSPHNVVFDAAVSCPESGDRRYLQADRSWDCKGMQSAVAVTGTLDDHSDVDDHWTVEVALPFSQIGRDACPERSRRGKTPRDGEAWRANFYRIDRAGEGEFSCWSPTLEDPPNFHVPARFGNLVFSDEVA